MNEENGVIQYCMHTNKYSTSLILRPHHNLFVTNNHKDIHMSAVSAMNTMNCRVCCWKNMNIRQRIAL